LNSALTWFCLFLLTFFIGWREWDRHLSAQDDAIRMAYEMGANTCTLTEPSFTP
jgi:hypothetical protein